MSVVVDPAKRLARERAMEQERKVAGQDLERQVTDALMTNPDFVSCTTKGQRLSFARTVMSDFNGHAEYDTLNYRLADLAEIVFVKAKAKAKW